MKNTTRRKLALACYVAGGTGLVLAYAIGIYAVHLLQKQIREMDDWKSETQAELFQAVADQQARGVLEFNKGDRPSHLWPVSSRKKAAGQREESE